MAVTMWSVPSTSTLISPPHPPDTQRKRTRRWLVSHIFRCFKLPSSQRRRRNGTQTPTTNPVHDITSPPHSDDKSTHVDSDPDVTNDSIETLVDTYPHSHTHAEDLSLRRYLSPADGFGFGFGFGFVGVDCELERSGRYPISVVTTRAMKKKKSSRFGARAKLFG
ncbi:hypothetical protein Moror_11620 [Moniliophthora roreri MCA 2997]|uniref:Uncharacterized protein n=2 Tax=Moniliophthora roreri TaxID=221103 RepID=V2X4Q9_MONRO|nr:hypothetical protein Moror_11620 [Moniliophthora roreri MCA 2997]